MPNGSSAPSGATSQTDGSSVELHRRLWAVLDAIRKQGLSAHAGSDVILGPLAGLLVLRWAAHDESEREAVAAFDEGDFTSELPPALRSPAWAEPTSRRAENIINALKAMPARNGAASAPTRLVTRVEPLITDAAQRAPSIFEQLLDWVAQVDLATPEGRAAVASVFDELLSTMVNKQSRHIGMFTTPQPVADLMVELVSPEPGDRVYDPCFGFGGLLVNAARRLREAARTASPRAWANVQHSGIFGVEINPLSYAVGLCRILLAGIDRPGLELADALDRPLPRNRSSEGFDCILAAPPWGGWAHRTVTSQFPFPTGNIENLFLQHVMANLRPGGRAVVAVPEGTLFRPGTDRKVRKALLSDYRVDAVISLPPDSFAPCTSIPASLLVFRRDTPKASVRFVRAAGISSRHPSWQSELWRRTEGMAESDPNFTWELSTLAQSPEHPGDIVAEVRGDVDQLVEFRDWAWDVAIKDLAQRDHELVVKKSGAQTLDAELDRLATADPSLRIKGLEKVAEVFAGLSYERSFTTEQADAPDVVAGLLRVGDVTDLGARAPTLFLTLDGKGRAKDKHALRFGDIVVTTSGTIGKVGLISDVAGTVGAVATKSMAVVRARESVTPPFLAALLRSPTYQDWLSGHARGTTIQHLSIRTLRKLQIPVPEVPVQDAVLSELAGQRGDAMAVLGRILSGAPDPVAALLARPEMAGLLVQSREEDAAVQLDKVGRVLASSFRLRHDMASSRKSKTDAAVAGWMELASELGHLLEDVDQMPPSTGQLALLQSCDRMLGGMADSLAGSSGAISTRLGQLTRSLRAVVSRRVRKLLKQTALELTLEPASVNVGPGATVSLRVCNSADVAIRGGALFTSFDNVRFGYLPEHTELLEDFKIPGPLAAGTVDVDIHWRVDLLDGSSRWGDTSLQLLVRSVRDAVRSGDLGASPYIVGNPVDRQEMFFGRSDVIERIQRQLSASANANVILLEGNRRTGKTSILRQLAKPDALPGWIPVYCSFQDAEGDDAKAGITTRNVFRLLARQIGWTLSDSGVETWFPDLPARDSRRPFKVAFRGALDQAFSGEHSFETFELYLAAAVEAASPRRILIMLDEFDKLQEGIDAGITSPQVPENIRHLLQHQEGISAILTGSRRLKRLREEYWSALFGLGYRIGISALPIEEARRLVTEPVEGRLSYLPQACDRLVELCACHPFLVQSLCNRVFERAAAGGEPTITVATVDDAASDMVRDNEHFRTLWDYAGTARRRSVLALCDRFADGADAVNLDLLKVKLHDLGIPVRRGSDLADDLAELRELELLDFDESYRGGTYRLAVPLMARWLQTNIDFEDVVVRAKQEDMEAHS